MRADGMFLALKATTRYLRVMTQKTIASDPEGSHDRVMHSRWQSWSGKHRNTLALVSILIIKFELPEAENPVRRRCWPTSVTKYPNGERIDGSQVPRMKDLSRRCLCSSFSILVLYLNLCIKVIYTLICSTVTYWLSTVCQGTAVNKNRQNLLPWWSSFSSTHRMYDAKGYAEK